MKLPAKSTLGFTLAELLVVIGIVGLVLATVVVARPKAGAIRVAATARAIAETLQLARAQAMTSNTETVVEIDPVARQFGQARSMHGLPRGMTVALTIAETERSGDSGGIRFYPDGQSSGGVIEIGLEGKSTHIAVNWLTGEPRLSR